MDINSFFKGSFSKDIRKPFVNKSDFLKVDKEKTGYRKYILVKPENADYPIVIYRKDESTYSALLLRCTHQGNELTVSGDLLTCSAHGSEFSNSGEIIQGPADQQLKSFVVTNDEKFIYVQL